MTTDLSTSFVTTEQLITAVKSASSLHNIGYIVQVSSLTITSFGFALCIIGNTLTWHILKRKGIFQEMECLLYKALVLNDILVSFFNLSMNLISICGLQFCTEMFLAILLLNYESVILISTININRLLLIMQPLHYPILVTKRRLFTAVLIANVVIYLLLLIMYLKFRSVYLTKDVCWKEIQSFVPNTLDTISHILAASPALAGIAVITISNAFIVHKARQQSLKIVRLQLNGHQRGDDGQGNQQAHRERGRKRVLKGMTTVCVVTASYVIVWLPFVVYILAPTAGVSLPRWFILLFSLSAECNSFINPFLFYWTNRSFKLGFAETMSQLRSSCFRKARVVELNH